MPGKLGIDITSFSVTSKIGSEERVVIGKRDPSKYPFGRIMVEGEFTLDLPNDGLKHMGSMLDNEAFAITGTWFNAADDQIAFNMPNCRRNPFSVNQGGGEETNELSVPYTAYESADKTTTKLAVKLHDGHVVETGRFFSRKKKNHFCSHFRYSSDLIHPLF